jgi:hypothetical protein
LSPFKEIGVHPELTISRHVAYTVTGDGGRLLTPAVQGKLSPQWRFYKWSHHWLDMIG